MNASDVTAPPEVQPKARPRRTRAQKAARIVGWIVGVPVALLALLYLVLLITPVPLPFANNAAKAMVISAMPPSADLRLGDVALAVENGVAPVIRFDGVSLNDSKTGARIRMDALELGFSALRALVGQPGAVITLVGPRIQIVQDLFGPRASRFEFVTDPNGGGTTVRVLEGQDAFPPIGISEQGIAALGEPPEDGEVTLRSNNDWLIYNLQSSEQGMADLLLQAEMGRFSRLRIRNGTVGMIDSVYGLYRRFEDIDLDVAPAAVGDSVAGEFAATVGGRRMTGSILRTLEGEDRSRLEIDMTNMDFASILPFLDDPASLVAVRGAGAISMDIVFDTTTSLPQTGDFKLDMTGLDLRISDDSFPIASSILEAKWLPDRSRFTLSPGSVTIGESKAVVSGIFAMGLDEEFGPTIAVSMQARDVFIQPDDMEAQLEPFDEITFSGWSAPLYGALGIDRMVARRGDGFMEAQGRIDMLLAGIGIDIALNGKDVTADDLKRLWPYVTGTESRDWLVANIAGGTVESTNMRFDFPVGAIAVDGSGTGPLPEGSMSVNLVGNEVLVRPMPEMEPLALEGQMVLNLRDNELSVSAAGSDVPGADGGLAVSQPALYMDYSDPEETLFEISGDVASEIPQLVAIARQYAPEALASNDLPVPLDALSGSVDASVLATITLPAEAEPRIDYVLNGSVSELSSEAPIAERRISDANLTFSASQARYQVTGTAAIDGVEADVEITGTPTSEPRIRLAADVTVEDLAEFGFDAGDFLSGQARLVAQPGDDESLQVIIDLTQAGLDLHDLGIRKNTGVPGTLRAVVRQQDDGVQLTDVDLAFADVHLAGELTVDAASGLQSAEFSTFRLSAGDSARASLAPQQNGYALTLQGAQFDLKPMLRQVFGLDQGAGGVETTQFDQRISVRADLDRAVGFYGTTAFNVDLAMTLSGSDLTNASVSASFGEGNGLSVATNPTPRGRVMSVAFNDAGTILRFIGVYSQLAGGEGSLTLNRDRELDIEAGELRMRDFAIVDENNVSQILGNHADSREMIEARNRLDFNSGRVTFQRTDDSVRVTDAVLSGDTVGGTMEGYIYTDQRRYDLTGTYVPLFGLNNAFQKIPLFGPLLGGREGEGLVGVTFAVRGPLDNPQFQINPLSALVPGVFRELFEFRSQGQQQQ
ncbi:hypothetical protein GCM10007989_01300 [Devosia pacifica]|uniref:AsmA-like C-terminal region n=1 Tax=Devosia pacifica TaxID=1335967 RepID=A0A918RSM6_9HYPH|nr:AsmA-like C-terminal domain-containing protein [Devosia pacifica]GHA10793.1 hypothetical protein GCM10007989_01300 [Devosia pacifica]